MALIRGHHSFDDHFTQIPNDWLRDQRLSLGAIGLLAQLLSHSPGWKITQENLARANNVGRDAIRTLINELVTNGYLLKSEKRERNSSGQLAGYNYVTTDPVLGEPTLAEPTQAEPTLADPTHKKTINKNNIVKNTISKKRALSDSWKPNESVYSDERYVMLDIDREAEAFRDWHAANGSKFVDWDAAFRNWLKKGVAFSQKRDYRESERERERRELDAWIASLPDEEKQ